MLQSQHCCKGQTQNKPSTPLHWHPRAAITTLQPHYHHNPTTPLQPHNPTPTTPLPHSHNPTTTAQPHYHGTTPLPRHNPTTTAQPHYHSTTPHCSRAPPLVSQGQCNLRGVTAHSRTGLCNLRQWEASMLAKKVKPVG